MDDFTLAYMIFALFNGLVLKLDVPNSKVSPFPLLLFECEQGVGCRVQVVSDYLCCLYGGRIYLLLY